MTEFAKIILTKDGQQVLFYVEPDGNDYVFNQIINHEAGVINVRFVFNKPSYEDNANNAYAYLERVNADVAEKIVEKVISYLKMPRCNEREV